MAYSWEELKQPEVLLEAATPVVLSVLGALLTFLIGKWLIRLIVNGVRRGMRRARVDDTLGDFLGNVLYGIGLAVVIIAALGQLGVNTTSAAALLGGAALAIGLSLQGQLSSLAAGVILIIFRPFKKGDFVNIGGAMGVVEEIKIIHTTLKTLDNQIVVVPNNNITTQNITNYSALPTRRIDLTIGIGYGSDLLKAKQVLQELLETEPRILKDPAPSVVVSELADNAVNFAFRGWTASGDWWATRCDLTERIKLRFDEEGIEIPFPQRSVHVEGLADALRGAAPAANAG
jgi:small conductance mechanosensitive channel